MHHFKAPNSTSEYNNYLVNIKNKLKFESRGISDKHWEYPEDEIKYLRAKTSLNLGQYHRAYCNVFGFGYQKMFKLIKAHKKYLIERNIIVVKQKEKKINKETNKGNTLEILVVNHSKFDILADFLKNFKV